MSLRSTSRSMPFDSASETSANLVVACSRSAAGKRLLPTRCFFSLSIGSRPIRGSAKKSYGGMAPTLCRLAVDCGTPPAPRSRGWARRGKTCGKVAAAPNRNVFDFDFSFEAMCNGELFMKPAADPGHETTLAARRPARREGETLSRKRALHVCENTRGSTMSSRATPSRDIRTSTRRARPHDTLNIWDLAHPWHRCARVPSSPSWRLVSQVIGG